MGIIGTLYESESSFTRFCYDDGQIIAAYWGMSGHQDGGKGEEILAEAGNFDEACRWVAQNYSPYAKNPNFRFEFSGKAWVGLSGATKGK